MAPSKSSFENEFVLDGEGGHYRREINASWCNQDDRVFGGYTSALCFAAAARDSEHPALCSGQIMFLDGVRPGQISFETVTLRKGRSLTAIRVDAFQSGRRVLSCQTWLRATPLGRVSPALIDQDPSRAADLSWLSKHFGFHGWMESRGVDYPQSMDHFSDEPKRIVDVWMRPKAFTSDSGFVNQLFDVLIADAFIADSHLRGGGCAPEDLLSLDLSIQWTPRVHSPGWRRILAESPAVSDGSAACVCTIFDQAGSVCATAAQQAWINPRRRGTSA